MKLRHINDPFIQKICHIFHRLIHKYAYSLHRRIQHLLKHFRLLLRNISATLLCKHKPNILRLDLIHRLDILRPHHSAQLHSGHLFILPLCQHTYLFRFLTSQRRQFRLLILSPHQCFSNKNCICPNLPKLSHIILIPYATF